MTIDVGTGDGRSIIATAAAEPTTLAIGLDPVATAMADASRRAARSVARGGLPNAVFLVGSAERPAPALVGVADRVTVRFPWGSLLRGCVGLDAPVAAGLVSLLRPGGMLELLIAPADADGLADIPTLPASVITAVQGAFGPLGLSLVEARPASVAEITASRSTWAKRLLAGGIGVRERAWSGVSSARVVTMVRLRSCSP